MKTSRHLFLIASLMIIIPFVMLFTIIIVIFQPFSTRTLDDVRLAPPLIRRSLQAFMEKRNPETVDKRILLIVYEDDGIIYRDPSLKQLFTDSGTLGS